MMAKICPIDVSRDFKISEHPGHEGSKKERSKCLKGLKGERERGKNKRRVEDRVGIFYKLEHFMKVKE